jgi:PAS domain S-box-containing protein
MEDDQSKNTVNKSYKYYVAILAFLTGMIITTIVTISLYNIDKTHLVKEKSEFRRSAELITSTIEDKIQDDVLALQNIASFFYGSDHVTHQEFEIFTQPILKRFYYHQEIIWAPKIELADKQQFIKQARENYPAYQIKQFNRRGDLHKASKRNLYYPIYYLEKLSKSHRKLLGIDLGHNKQLLKGLDQARDTGKIVIARNVDLSHPQFKKPIFLIYPLYKKHILPEYSSARRKNLRGFIILVQQLTDTIPAILQTEAATLDITIIDLTSPANKQIFYHHGKSKLDPQKLSQHLFSKEKHRRLIFDYHRILKVGKVSLLIHITPMLGYHSKYIFGWYWLFVIFILGFLLSGVFCFYTWRIFSVREILQVGENRFRTLIETAADAIFSHDKQGKIKMANTTACESLDYTHEELLSKNILDIEVGISKDNLHKLWNKMQDEKKVILEGKHRRKNGTIFPVEVHLSMIRLGEEKLMLALVRDLTERKRAEKALKESEKKFKALFESTLDGIYVVDKHRRIIDWNNGAEHITGYSKEDVLGKDCKFLQLACDGCPDVCQEKCPMLRVFKEQKAIKGDVKNLTLLHKKGTRVPVRIIVMPLFDDKGELAGGIKMFFDVSEQVSREEMLRRIAVTDKLTQVHNRSDFDFVIVEECERAKRYKQPLSMLFIDIDDFCIFQHHPGTNSCNTRALIPVFPGHQFL